MTNQEFLTAIGQSFEAFIESGTSRSTKKLKPLHGAIAKDIALRLGCNYQVFSQGYGNDKEASVHGRYFDKMVDITISDGKKMVCGIAVKFIMQNYSQNSNNYFENMLGETANIRCGNCPYFQIFIVLDKLPYYKKDKTISKWETFTEHNFHKYHMLSKDSVENFLHTPNKTLIYVVHLPDGSDKIKTLEEYVNFYKSANNRQVKVSDMKFEGFGDSIILNNYEAFVKKVCYTVLSL